AAAWSAHVPAGPSRRDGDAVPLRYDRDIRPLLADRCFRCHGQDEKKRRANLRLDEPESAYAARKRGPAIVPGDLDESELLHRCSSDEEKFRMPPPSSNKRPFSEEEQERLRRWIQEGARYEPHWAFVPPQRPPLPPMTAGARNAVDRFVFAKLA